MRPTAARYLALGAALILAAPAVAAAQRCPDVDPATGYRITARADLHGADTAWLSSVARAAAYRWKVPSSRRNLYTGWEQVRRRILPPEPRWADDWTPQERHRAELRVTLFSDTSRTRAELTTRSGDRLFDLSIESIFTSPMPASPPIPSLPRSVSADSLILLLSFGDTSTAGPVGEVRFAAVQTRGELVPNTLRVQPPSGYTGAFPLTAVKYDILESGRVDAASFEFPRSPGPRFEEVIRDGLMQASFRAPTSNCRPVAQTVIQTFGR